ncbi:cytochrome d ubiquinol oxidase subunit II [Williamsia sp. CHRR-6]|uniref:cytochrome d ubiquinol oxidase subunit II n=1 Tax=Williamsia sp. CHRR-6 TaxID=2835871 RepID=UPI001BD9B618|nr:cytochrome d ubiquinol oxidase subunit II [Williamsia sp. CHRR-6]MBT0566325.1 cytochrome d ubiquinol oxidase subunit II [Williamsia sp. CHRR-6]
MTLPEVWFVVVAVLFAGYFLLEGFDFGVGMALPFLGRGRDETAEDGDVRRRTLINTIGPVWDGNEVWLLTGGGAMFAAFPIWYATMFSAMYLALLVILVGLITRVVAIEWRGKIDDPRWRRWCDVGIGLGSWLPALLWGVAFANLVRGLPLDSGQRFTGTFFDLLSPYALLGGLTTLLLFGTHGLVFLTLKTDGHLRIEAMRAARVWAVPTVIVFAVFGGWTLAYGEKGWLATVLAVGVAASIVIAAAAAAGREVVAFAATSVSILSLVVLIFGSLWPVVIRATTTRANDLTIAAAASSHYTLTVMTWAAVVMVPVVLAYQIWTYWVFRQRISTAHIPPSIGLSLRVRRS